LLTYDVINDKLTHLSSLSKVIHLNILAGEHKTGDFPSINPQTCVPTLVDGDFVLWESKAILVYLAEKQSMLFRSSLFPKCPKTRGLVMQRLFFDSNDFYSHISQIIESSFTPHPSFTRQSKDKLEKALDIMENFLDGNIYFAGKHLTLADFVFCGSISMLTCLGFDIKNYEKVSVWFEQMKELKGFDQCLSGAQEMAKIVCGNMTNTFDDV
jgi:glutathione S-transferase